MMSRPQLKRPSTGTALGFLALIVALAGNANAGSDNRIVRKGDLAKGAVTARALAPGAVKAKALAKGAVTAKALRRDAVNAAALGPDAVTTDAIRNGAVAAGALGPNAVTASALAPGSVYGGALGPVAIRSSAITDLDVVAENGTWTASNTATATCAPGERLLSGGVVFTNPGNREVGVIHSVPFGTASASGFAGQITSNSGGTATAEVQALCLK